ncbi:unnamed protein product, partial [Closterium sp. Naga37s-1]
LPPYRLPTLPPAHLTTSNPSLLIRAQVWRKVHVVRSILALGYDVVLTDRAVLWGVNSRAVIANANLFTATEAPHPADLHWICPEASWQSCEAASSRDCLQPPLLPHTLCLQARS